LGILSGNIDKLIANEAYKPFYMHGIGHWLGMDVHDVGSYGSPKKGSVRKFEPGMVLTIEPGIYISSKNRKVEKKWRGIGIRIEDDILVKKNGNEILTHKLPKEIDDIESIMANH
jgi:Xaa-Pro aminopeptidase